MIQRLYVIRDKVAGAAVGGVMGFPHDAVAVRSFSDIASDPQTTLARHIADHELICVGVLDTERCEVVQCLRDVVITGEAWAAAQAKSETANVG